MFLLRVLVVLGSLLYGIEVKTVVYQESLVFRCHDSHGHAWRHLIERHPLVMPAGHLATCELLHGSYAHQRCDTDGDVAVSQCHKDGGCEKQCQHPPYYFPNYSHLRSFFYMLPKRHTPRAMYASFYCSVKVRIYSPRLKYDSYWSVPALAASIIAFEA